MTANPTHQGTGAVADAVTQLLWANQLPSLTQQECETLVTDVRARTRLPRQLGAVFSSPQTTEEARSAALLLLVQFLTAASSMQPRSTLACSAGQQLEQAGLMQQLPGFVEAAAARIASTAPADVLSGCNSHAPWLCGVWAVLSLPGWCEQLFSGEDYCARHAVRLVAPMLQLALLALQRASRCLELLPADTEPPALLGAFTHQAVQAMYKCAAQEVATSPALHAEIQAAGSTSQQQQQQQQGGGRTDSSGVQQQVQLLLVSRCTWPALFLIQTITCYATLLSAAQQAAAQAPSAAPGTSSGSGSRVLQGVAAGSHQTAAGGFLLQDPQQLKDPWEFACSSHGRLPLAHQQLLALTGCSSRVVVWAAACLLQRRAHEAYPGSALAAAIYQLIAAKAMCAHATKAAAAAAGCYELLLRQQLSHAALQAQQQQQVSQRLLQLQAEQDMFLLAPAVLLHCVRHSLALHTRCDPDGILTLMRCNGAVCGTWRAMGMWAHKLAGVQQQQQGEEGLPPTLDLARLGPLMQELLDLAAPTLHALLDAAQHAGAAGSSSSISGGAANGGQGATGQPQGSTGQSAAQLLQQSATLCANFTCDLTLQHVNRYGGQQQQQVRHGMWPPRPLALGAWQQHGAQVCCALERCVRLQARCGTADTSAALTLSCKVAALLGSTAWAWIIKDPSTLCVPHPAADSILLQAAAAAGRRSPQQQQLLTLAFSLLKVAGRVGPQQQAAVQKVRSGAACAALRMLFQSLPDRGFLGPSCHAGYGRGVDGSASDLLLWLALAGRCMLLWALYVRQWVAGELPRPAGGPTVPEVGVLPVLHGADITRNVRVDGTLARDGSWACIVLNLYDCCCMLLRQPQVAAGLAAAGYDMTLCTQPPEHQGALMACLGLAYGGPLRSTDPHNMGAALVPTPEKLTALAGGLQEMGDCLSLLAFSGACNHRWCSSLSEGSEAVLVKGRSSLCAGCRTARYCSKECQAQHWPLHRKVCKALAAAAAAGRRVQSPRMSE